MARQMKDAMVAPSWMKNPTFLRVRRFSHESTAIMRMVNAAARLSQWVTT